MSLNNMTPKETAGLGQATPAQSAAPSAADFVRDLAIKEKWPTPNIIYSVRAAEAYAALRTAQLQAELVNQQRESAQIRRAYLHEKWCKETAESALSEARERTRKEIGEELLVERSVEEMAHYVRALLTSSASAKHEHLWEAQNGNPDDVRYLCKCGAAREVRKVDGVITDTVYE